MPRPLRLIKRAGGASSHKLNHNKDLAHGFLYVCIVPPTGPSLGMNRRHFLGLGGLVAGAALLPVRALAATAPDLAARPVATADLLARVRTAFARHGSAIPRHDIVGIADFSRHSATRRFHLLDMESGRLDSLLVAHGRGSDPDHTGFVQRFSNREGSNASSEGAYVTSNSYVGQHGNSRRLIGLDPENDAALQRAIVIHGADYVSSARAASGPIGRSFGCFAFAQADIARVLERLGPGRLLLAYKA